MAEETGSEVVLGRRLTAAAVDVALVAAVAGVTTLGALAAAIWFSVGGSSLPWSGGVLVALLLIAGAVTAVLVLLIGDVRGTSPGRRLLRVRVQRAATAPGEPGLPPGLLRGSARGVARLAALALVLIDTGLGALILVVLLRPAAFDPRGRGLHDRILGTEVVIAPRATPASSVAGAETERTGSSQGSM